MKKTKTNNKPTEEEYVTAKEGISYLLRNIQLSEDRIMQLVDALVEEKKALGMYNDILDKNKKVVMLYELYEEVEAK